MKNQIITSVSAMENRETAKSRQRQGKVVNAIAVKGHRIENQHSGELGN